MRAKAPRDVFVYFIHEAQGARAGGGDGADRAGQVMTKPSFKENATKKTPEEKASTAQESPLHHRL